MTPDYKVVSDFNCYMNLDHALRRAFGEPRPDYGKMLDFSGVMRSVGIAPMDQIAQDGMTRYLLEEELNVGQRMILYLKYDGTADMRLTSAAVDLFTEVFGNKRDGAFARESVVRWSKRRLLANTYTMQQWASHLDISTSTLAARRKEIKTNLNVMLMNAEGAAATLLMERKLIPKSSFVLSD